MPRIKYGDVDLNLLFVLERVLSRQSVSEAAVDLGLSQSATSRALQRLRDTVDDPLLVRAGRELVPTDRARELLGPAVEALAAVEDLFAPAPTFDPSSAIGPFVFAVGDEMQEVIGPALLDRLAQEAPGIDLRFRALGNITVEEGRRGLIDLAMGPDLSALPALAGAPDLSEFVLQPIYTRHFRVFGSVEAWPTAPDLEQYLQAQHAIVSFEAGGRGFVDELLAEKGLSRRVVVSATTFQAVARMVRGSRLLAVMPEEIALTMHGQLAVWDAPVPLPPLPMMLIWHPRQRTQGRHRFLRRLVAEVVRARVAELIG